MLYQVIEDGEITESYAMPDHDDTHHKFKVETITTGRALVNTDNVILCDCTSANVITTLPLVADSEGRRYRIIKIDSSSYYAGIDGNGVETIDGALGINLYYQWDSIIIQCNGSEWVSISKNIDLRSIVTLTTAYPSLGEQHYTVLGDAASNDVEFIPATVSSCKGRVYNIKKIDSSVNTVTFNPSGAELVDGAATKVLSSQWEHCIVQCDGSAWYVIG